MQRMGWIAAFGLVLFVGGCSSNEGPADGPEVGAAAAETSVRVENQSFNDMTIYVYERSQRVRLGSVPGLSTRTFRIPDRMLFGISSLQFEADPLGGNRSSISQEIAVSQGQTLRLVIPPL